MLIRAGYEIAIECNLETPLMALVSVHPSRQADLRSPAIISSSGTAPLLASIDEFGNVRTRTVAPAGVLKLATNFVIQDSGLPDEVAPWAGEVPVSQLPDDAVSFLLGSRYCETDRLSPLAWSLFGQHAARLGSRASDLRLCAPAFDLRLPVRAQYAHRLEGHEERVGVCRDFAHLAIALCRCMNIPARYATGYLGDIGVPAVRAPMDFSAWFEVYLGGRSGLLSDARHNMPRVGRILVARGRDAADCRDHHHFRSVQVGPIRDRDR